MTTISTNELTINIFTHFSKLTTTIWPFTTTYLTYVVIVHLDKMRMRAHVTTLNTPAIAITCSFTSLTLFQIATTDCTFTNVTFFGIARADLNFDALTFF